MNETEQANYMIDNFFPPNCCSLSHLSRHFRVSFAIVLMGHKSNFQQNSKKKNKERKEIQKKIIIIISKQDKYNSYTEYDKYRYKRRKKNCFLHTEIISF